jgi:gamma-glutamyltranspeptidase/glutathione hydrolase
VFDATPSGGWIPGAVILGDTGIGMSIRGEQFWLDKAKANQMRPRARPRYTLTPSLVFKGDAPLMALGTPGGDNQDQTILRGVPERRGVLGRLVPEPPSGLRVVALPDPALPRLVLAAHDPGLNKLNLEATIPEAVFAMN